MSSKHAEELKGIKAKHSSKSPGACLHRHGNSKVRKNDFCSYRWQGLLNAEDNEGFYNHPAYASLVAGPRIRTDKLKKGYPSWYPKTLKAPQVGEWNVTAIVGAKNQKNFRDKCYQPYWHEAHHIVPDDVIRQAIEFATEGSAKPGDLRRTVRGGLLDEKYNLNDKLNMFLLPMDMKISVAIALPKHRQTPSQRNHKTYSDKVFTELKKVFKDVKKDLQLHKTPDYDACKSGIEELSTMLHGQIRAAGEIDKAASLDQMLDSRFQPPSP